MAAQRRFLLFGFGAVLLASLIGAWTVRRAAGGARHTILDWYWAPLIAGSDRIPLRVSPSSHLPASAIDRICKLLASKHRSVSINAEPGQGIASSIIGEPAPGWVARFSLRTGPGQERSVVDRLRKEWHWQATASADYLVLTRFVGSAGAGPHLSIAAFTDQGLAAGAQLITDNDALTRALQNEPALWPTVTVEIVARVPLAKGSAAQPEIVTVALE